MLSVVETSSLDSFFWLFKKTKQISIRLFSCLPNVVKINSCVKKYFPSQNFRHKKNLTKTKFLPFGRIFLFFFSILFHSRKHFCERTPVLLVLSLCISLSLKKTLPYFQNESLSIFFVFFYKFFFSAFSSLLVFVHHVSHSPPFSFPFRLIFLFFLISFFLNSFFFTVTFFNLFEQQVPFLFVSKSLQLFTFYMHTLPLCVLLFIHLFICCLFLLFLCSLTMTSFWNTYLTLLHFHKLFTFLLDIFTNLYVFACSSFLSVFFLLFCVFSCFFWTFSFSVLFLEQLFFLCVFFCCPFWMYLSFFWRFSLIWLSFFCFCFNKNAFTYSPFFSKTTFFSKLFPCFLDSTEWLDGMLSPSSCFFTSLEKIT